MPTPSPSALQAPQNSRIYLSELKSEMIRRLGVDRAQQYFDHLSKFLSQKINKPQFSKFCIVNLGRENIPLHNQLIRSILRNACQGKYPPPMSSEIMPSKSFQFSPKHVIEKGVRNLLPNGEMLLPSSCKARSSIHESGIKDAQIPFQNLSHFEEGASLWHQNLSFEPRDMEIMIQKRHPGVTERQLAKRPRKERLPSEDDNSKKTTRVDVGFHMKPLQAPLGIPFCPISVGGARQLLSSSSGVSNGCCDTGELCDSEVLWGRMQKIAEIQGIAGVDVDTANMLNCAVDVYLKRLIQSCVELVNSRSECNFAKPALEKQLIRVKQVNGFQPSFHTHLPSFSRGPPDINEPINCQVVKMEDFRVAMELSPHHLGEDWPFLMEKICYSSFQK